MMHTATGFRPAFTRAIVGGAFLAVAAASAFAQSGPAAEPPPDADWTEEDRLLHYATVVCVQAAYRPLVPPAVAVHEALGREAWAMVELTRQEPAVYDRIHGLAAVRGKAEVPSRALAGCGAWARRHADTILQGAVLAR